MSPENKRMRFLKCIKCIEQKKDKEALNMDEEKKV